MKNVKIEQDCLFQKKVHFIAFLEIRIFITLVLIENIFQMLQ